jgi:hypothetical protein
MLLGKMSTAIICTSGRCFGKHGGRVLKKGDESVDERGKNSSPPYSWLSECGPRTNIPEEQYLDVTADVTDARHSTNTDRSSEIKSCGELLVAHDPRE